MRIALVLVCLVACETGTKKLPPRPEMIDAVRAYAERVCACGTDRDCVEPIRAEWDAAKRDILAHGLTGEPLGQFTRELDRLRHCGDAAGLTIWL